MEKTMLVVIKGGLPQCADPIVCDDLIGPNSLFCHMRHAPTIIRDITENDFILSDDEVVKKMLLRRGAVLWEKGEVPLANADLSINFTMFVCGVVTSTFDALWFLHKHLHLSPWTCLLAPIQTKGRGQMRREWLSPRGNMYASFILPDAPIFRHDAAAIAVGYLAVKALRRLGYDLYLKWPNDIVTQDLQKVGGILLEERGGVAMAGIGLNIVSAPAPGKLRHSRCLPAGLLEKNMLDGNFCLSPFLLCKELVNSVIVEYTYLQPAMDFSIISGEANTLLALNNSRVIIDDDTPHPVPAFCLGLGNSGGLVVRYDDGTTAEITSGSILPES